MPKLLTQGVSSEPKNGRQLIGIVAGFKSERWPDIDRNAGRLHVGIRIVLFGLAGVVLIVRPGAVPLNPGHLVTLGAALAFALTYIVTKALTRSDNATKILFWMLIIQSMIGVLPALQVWAWPSAVTWPWIFLFAFAGSFAHFCMAKALHHGEVTFVMPIDYLRMPMSAFLGYLLYAEAIDVFTAAGAALIVVGNLFNLGRPNANG